MIEFLMLVGMALAFSIAVISGIFCGWIIGKVIYEGIINE